MNKTRYRWYFTTETIHEVVDFVHGEEFTLREDEPFPKVDPGELETYADKWFESHYGKVSIGYGFEEWDPRDERFVESYPEGCEWEEFSNRTDGEYRLYQFSGASASGERYDYHPEELRFATVEQGKAKMAELLAQDPREHLELQDALSQATDALDRGYGEEDASCVLFYGAELMAVSGKELWAEANDDEPVENQAPYEDNFSATLRYGWDFLRMVDGKYVVEWQGWDRDYR